MFGTVVANVSSLSDEQLNRYRGAYCGLCRMLKSVHGELSRFTLSYDMTFLILLLSSLYEPAENSLRVRCLPHPIKKHGCFQNKFTAYAADMSLILTYHNFLDDWADDKNPLSYAGAKLFLSRVRELERSYPRQSHTIASGLERLGAIEKEGLPSPDAAANSFGALLGEIFVYEEDIWAPTLRKAGAALGRFIYISDACCDLESDRRRGRYNPLINTPLAEFEPILSLLMGECAAELTRLPLVQDIDILKNIVYSGVWAKYNESKKRSGGESPDD